ncbi:hypothetical protein V3390_02345 [Luteimonas sp. FXH3W]|uniref:Uncharacterized protein n=1 Tax=Aquilutibacter rugosus TaxID=3115820 RepID=A0ABU7UYN0_9GAMM
MKSLLAPALTLALCVSMAPRLANADQFEYNTLKDAVAAMQIVNMAGQVKYYCAPCGDKQARNATVDSTGIALVWDPVGPSSNRPYVADGRQYWELEINGKPVDLAYIYIRDGEKWRNLAMAIGQTPVEVPETI